MNDVRWRKTNKQNQSCERSELRGPRLNSLRSSSSKNLTGQAEIGSQKSEVSTQNSESGVIDKFKFTIQKSSSNQVTPPLFLIDIQSSPSLSKTRCGGQSTLIVKS